MKILALSEENKFYDGWVEMDDKYSHFVFDKNTNDVSFYESYPIKEFDHYEYSNYVIFVSRMLLHEMEIEFLKYPIEISTLSKSELERAMKEINSV